MENNKIFLMGTALIITSAIVISSLTAEPQARQVEELDMLLLKSEENLQKATQMCKAIDQVTTDQVTKLKTSVEVLQEEKQQLTTKLYETKVILDGGIDVGSTFKLEPILSDTARNR
jgi:hypothetical protein